jgi:cytochrome c5
MKNKNITPYVVVAFLGLVILACSSPKAKVASADSYEKITVSPAAPPKLEMVALDEKGQIIPVDEKVKQKNLANRMAMLTDAESKGKDLYTTRCAECHDLPTPTQYKETRWAVIMQSMKDKAKLDDKEFSLVQLYTSIYFEK